MLFFVDRRQKALSAYYHTSDSFPRFIFIRHELRIFFLRFYREIAKTIRSWNRALTKLSYWLAKNTQCAVPAVGATTKDLDSQENWLLTFRFVGWWLRNDWNNEMKGIAWLMLLWRVQAVWARPHAKYIYWNSILATAKTCQRVSIFGDDWCRFWLWQLPSTKWKWCSWTAWTNTTRATTKMCYWCDESCGNMVVHQANNYR